MKTVSIVDHDREAGHRLRTMVNASGRFSCVSLYTDWAMARHRLPADAPQIVVIDPGSPQSGGTSELLWLRQKMVKTEFMACTSQLAPGAVLATIQAGAVGYISKGIPMEEFIAALDQMAGGRSPLCPSAARILLREFRKTCPETPFDAALTKRESEILNEIVKGRMLKEMISSLGISQGTLNTHMRRLYRKLGVNSRTEIMARYLSGSLSRPNRLHG